MHSEFENNIFFMRQNKSILSEKSWYSIIDFESFCVFRQLSSGIEHFTLIDKWYWTFHTYWKYIHLYINTL